MSYLLVLLLAITNLPPDTAGPAPVPVTQSADAFETFKPSAILKQKRKIKQRVSFWGWGILAAGLLLIGGLVWLIVALWPGAALIWKILLVLSGISLGSLIVFMALFIFSYAYPTLRDVRMEAEARWAKFLQKKNFKADKTWCLPDDHYRIALALDARQILVVDYAQNKGWRIPASKVTNIACEAIPPGQLPQADYLETGNNITLTTRSPFRKRSTVPPYLGDWQNKPKQALRLDIEGLPLNSLTIIYAGLFEPADSCQNIQASIREMWQR